MPPTTPSPRDLLPDLFSQYLAFPQKVVVAPIVLLLGIILFLARGEAGPIASLSDSPPDLFSVSIGSPFSLSIALGESEAQVRAGSLSGTIRRKITGEYEFTSRDGVPYATLQSGTDSTFTFSRVDGSFQGRTKPDDEGGYKVLSSSGQSLSRVKMKEDKFNIYNPEGVRIYYGKEKKGKILVRDDTGRDVTWIDASGPMPLLQAAPLCMPLPVEFRSLLFVAGLNRLTVH